MSQGWGNPYSNIGKGRNRPNAIDIKSLLIKEIMAQGVPQSDSSTDPSLGGGGGGSGGSGGSGSNMLTEWATDDVYLYLDSTHRNFTSNLAAGQLIFDINPINNQKPLENVVSLRVNSFYFPRITGPANVPDYFFFGRAYLDITSSELPQTASVLSFNGNSYHFELDITNLNTVAVKMEPLDPVFYFQKPVQSLSQITLNFSTPLEFKPIPLPNDVLSVVALAGTNPAQFTINSASGTTSSLGAVGVPTAPGVAVYFENFLSPDPTLNTQVTSTTGYFVDNIISTTNFSVSALSFATLAANTPLTTIVAKNRIGIEIRFKSFRQQQTNGLVATNI